MKKLSVALAIIMTMSLFSSCKKIENKIIDISEENATTNISLQYQSPEIMTSEVTTSQTTTSESTTSETTTESTTTEQTTTTTVSTTTTTEPTTTTTVTTTTTPETTTTEEITTVPIYKNNYGTLNYDEQKGIWISYLEYLYLLKNKNESQFKSAINQIYSDAKDMGINTVYVHVRAHGDAYYSSDYFPWSKYLTGSIGGDPGYDPLKILIDEAHNKGLSFHAWVNPMRGPAISDISSYTNNYPIKQWYNDSSKNGKYIVASGSNYWLNPAYPEVRQLINSGIQEIVQNYDVDGIHIDDYFYPTTSSSFDKDAYSKSGATNLANWRRSTISEMVAGIYSTVKYTNPNVLFGVSPAGNISNNYSIYYADIYTWCSTTGYLDYITPQVYFGFDHPTLPFESCASQWNSIIKNSNIKLIIGLAAYKIGSHSNDWATDERIIARQIEYSKSLSNYDGIGIYSYRSLFYPTANVSTVNAELEAITDTLTD